ncbi:MAG: hypothetical protein ACRDQT_04215 [Gaiellaceae bacterium]
MEACPQCGHDSRESARFCESCGLALASSPARREQRKTVTVLFGDLTGSTALEQALERFRRKGNLVMTQSAHDRLAEIRIADR